MTQRPERQDPRIELDAELLVRFQDLPGLEEQYAANISLGGMYVRSEEPQPPGSIVSFEFVLGDDSSVLAGIGEVLWNHVQARPGDPPSGMGIHFRKLNDLGRELILRMMEQHISKGGDPFEIRTPQPPPEAARITALSALRPSGEPGEDEEGEPSSSPHSRHRSSQSRQVSLVLAELARLKIEEGKPDGERAEEVAAAEAPEAGDGSEMGTAELGEEVAPWLHEDEREEASLPVAQGGATVPTEDPRASDEDEDPDSLWSMDGELATMESVEVEPAAANGAQASPEPLATADPSDEEPLSAIVAAVSGTAGEESPNEPMPASYQPPSVDSSPRASERRRPPWVLPVAAALALAGVAWVLVSYAPGLFSWGDSGAELESDSPPVVAHEPARRETPLTLIQSVETLWVDGTTVVRITGNGTFDEGHHQHQRIEAPPHREVIKVLGIESPLDSTPQTTPTPHVRRVRVGYHPGGELHFVMDLANPQVRVTKIEARDSTLLVTLE